MADCPICLSADRFSCEEWPHGGVDGKRFECAVCGVFIVARSAAGGSLHRDSDHFPLLLRAVLSHRTRLQTEGLANSDDVPIIDSAVVRRLIDERPSLPSPSQQTLSALRYIGEKILTTFQPIDDLPPSFQALIGAPNRRFSDRIVRGLGDRGLLTYLTAGDMQHQEAVLDVDLTPQGWEIFEEEKKGKLSSNFGFIALKFNDPVLDPLLVDNIKPGLAESGYPVIDLRDVSKAGIIDNLLRAKIRDSKFVIVDLTHDNSGAYWEAGYAEGLGKPVIYICEKEKFEEKKTHFDTNHCTTVLWESSNIDNFISELVATIRRSFDD